MSTNKQSSLKIFGERHTGTNALQAFITQNFNVQARYYGFLGWKHRRAPQADEWSRIDYMNTLFIFTVRNPYTWLRSMHKEPYCWHQPDLKEMPFERFLQHSLEDYENVIKMWNEKNRSYVRMCQEVPHGLFVKLEDFALDQRAVYNRIAPNLHVKGGYQPYDKYHTGFGVKDQSVPDSLQIPMDLSSEALNLVAAQIDRPLMDFFGYPVIPPSTKSFEQYVKTPPRDEAELTTNTINLAGQ
jgi:hypothetical protein